MPPFKLDSVYSPTADQPAAIDGIATSVDAGERYTTLLGATGTGKTMTMAATIERLQRPGADPRPQQDARRAALQRVPHVLPAERRRVLRLLLRLLPARGLRPLEGPLHREGLGDQPGDRPPAPRRHGRAVRAPRRADRRLGVGDLRPRLAGDLQRQPADADQGRRRRPRRAAAQARLPPVQPQRHRARPRDVPGARRHAGDLPRLRGDGVPGDPVRRRGRAPPALRPADGRADRRRPRARRRSGRRRTTTSRRGRWSGRWPRSAASSTIAPPSSRRRASCSRPTACASAPSTTWRCCARSGSAPASRTTRASSTAARRAPARTA